MIKNKKDYIRFLQIEQGNARSFNFFYLYYKSSFQPTKRFLLLLRTCEYLKNTRKNKLLYVFVKYLKYNLGLKLGFSIPENVVEEGFQIPHYGTIVINANAKIGKNCRMHVCVNIGASGGGEAAPQIGDQVYFGPGVKIYGDIQISDRVAIAANAAVSKSCFESDVVLGGVPAKVIGKIDIDKIILVGKIK
jgi:serine O-acetyltransferase